MIVPLQSRIAREGLGITVRDLARAAKIAASTVNDFEMGRNATSQTIQKIEDTLELMGAQFAADGRRVGVFVPLNPKP